MECREQYIKVMCVERALYSLKSYGAFWAVMLFHFIQSSLGFEPTWLDNSVFIQKNVKENETYFWDSTYVCRQLSS